MTDYFCRGYSYPRHVMEAYQLAYGGLATELQLELTLEDPMHRSTVNKRSSARSFSKKAKRTHPKNLHVMRGGYRL